MWKKLSSSLLMFKWTRKKSTTEKLWEWNHATVNQRRVTRIAPVTLLISLTTSGPIIYTISHPIQYIESASIFQQILITRHGIVSTMMETELHSSLSQCRILPRIRVQHSNPCKEVSINNYIYIFLSIFPYLYISFSICIDIYIFFLLSNWPLIHWIVWYSTLCREGFSSF